MLIPKPTSCLFVALTLITALSSASLGQQPGFNVCETTIHKIHEAMKSGDLTCELLVRQYLHRLQHYDQRSGMNAIVLVNPTVIDQARQLDERFRETGKLLPLHGIPVVVKDNYDTFDMPTSGGSSALKHSIPPDDSFQVKRLREAGAIIFCKSNMAEWAFSPYLTESSTAGTTRNPYALDRVPAGSSGGTAAAVAANLGAIGLGTDTGNSIRGPSSHCALVGIRPTLGLTSRDGIIPLILRNDVGGPMCRTVEDAARVLQVIAGHDPADPITEKVKDRAIPDYLSALDPNGLNGKRIGVFRTLSNTKTADRVFLKLFSSALKDMEQAGAKLVDPFEVPGYDSDNLAAAQNQLWVETFDRDVTRYLATLNDPPIRNLNDIIAFRDYGDFLRRRLEYSRRARIPDALARPSSADPGDDSNRQQMLDAVNAAMDHHKVVAFVFPTWNNPPRKIGDLDSADGNNSFQLPPHTGQPAITVPMGFDSEGLPAGLQFVGRRFDEAELIKLAYAYEQATGHRKGPANFGPLEPNR